MEENHLHCRTDSNGTEARKLLNKGLVTEADLQPYQEALTAINNY